MIVLNHSFLENVAYRAESEFAVAASLVEHVRLRTGASPHVSSAIGEVETGAGSLVVWGNRMRGDAARGPLVELLLRTLSGPYVDGSAFAGEVCPDISMLPEWLQAAIRRLLNAELEDSKTAGMGGLLSPAPTGGADSRAFSGGEASVLNWSSKADFDSSLAAHAPSRSAGDVLREAEAQMGGKLVVLEPARRSAKDWKLDCSAADLHSALLGLEHYALAMREGRTREACAYEYSAKTSVEMSQEKGVTGKNPVRRAARTFDTGKYGKQYFDMHAKPGKMTRVHVWFVNEPDEETYRIYVGHCGRHLD